MSRSTGVFHNVPELPTHHLPRDEDLNHVKTLLLAGSVAISAPSIRVGVQGMGGIGKSVLAAAVAHDSEVQQAFPDGIVWVSIGQTPTLVSLQFDVMTALGVNPQPFDNPSQGTTRLREALRDKRCLLILDDVWKFEHANAFNALNEACRMLVTTRNQEIVSDLHATEHQVQVLNPTQAGQFLAESTSKRIDQLPPAAFETAKKCEYLPLALSLCAGLVRSGTCWEDVLEALQNADLEFLDQKQGSVLRSIKISVDALDEHTARAYLKLVVFPEDTQLPEATLATLWEHTHQVKGYRARRFITELASRALLRTSGDSPNRLIDLHDLQYLYLRHETTDLAATHNELIAAYWKKCSHGWASGPNDGYFFEHLPEHLIQAGKPDEARARLFDFEWLRLKLEYCNTVAVINDFDTYLKVTQPPASTGKETLSAEKLVRDALQLSAHILNKDRKQLRSQLWGRLAGFDYPEIKALLEQAREFHSGLWLRPTLTSLASPGGPLLFTLDGHKETVTSVAVFPDGNWVVSGSEGGTLKIWDLETRAELVTLTGRIWGVTAVAVLPDGRRLVSASWDHSLKVWEVATGAELATLTGHTREVTAVAVLPDGRRLVSASEDRTLKVWDLETRAVLTTLTGHTREVTAVAVLPDGRRLVSASYDKTLKVWEVATGAELATLTGHTSGVTAVAVLPDGRRLVSASEDRTLKVWDLETRVELATLTGHSETVKAVAVLPNGHRLVSASRDCTLKVWDLKTGTELTTFTGHAWGVTAVAVLPNGRRLVSASYDQTLKVWDLETGAELATLTRHTSRVEAVAVLPNGRRLVSASRNGTLKVWEVETGAELATLTGCIWEATAVAVLPDGRRLVLASRSGTLWVWDLETREELAPLTGHTREVTAVAVLPDGRRLVSASRDRTLKVWDAETGTVLATLTGHTREVTAVVVLPDGRRLVSASEDKTLKMWDLETRVELASLAGHTREVTAVVVLPDGRRLVSASRSGTLKMWDLETRVELASLAGHTWEVTAVAVLPDGHRLVSTSYDETLKVWDVETQQVLLTYFGDAPFTACAVSSDGTMIFAGDRFGRIHFLKLEE